MSAFMCNDYHISVLSTYCVENAPFRIRSQKGDELLVPASLASAEKRANAIEIGQTLARENRRSVNYRYNERKKTEFVYRTVDLDRYSPGDVIAAARCLDYQSCEREDYEKSKAKAIIDAIIIDAAKKLSTEGVWELRYPI